MNDSKARRSITGLQAIGIVIIVLVAIGAIGLALGWWTLWVDLG
jgi:hypothetical protein